MTGCRSRRWYRAHDWPGETSLVRPWEISASQTLIDRSFLIVPFILTPTAQLRQKPVPWVSISVIRIGNPGDLTNQLRQSPVRLTGRNTPPRLKSARVAFRYRKDDRHHLQELTLDSSKDRLRISLHPSAEPSNREFCSHVLRFGNVGSFLVGR